MKINAFNGIQWDKKMLYDPKINDMEMNKNEVEIINDNEVWILVGDLQSTKDYVKRGKEIIYPQLSDDAENLEIKRLTMKN